VKRRVPTGTRRLFTKKHRSGRPPSLVSPPLVLAVTLGTTHQRAGTPAEVLAADNARPHRQGVLVAIVGSTLCVDLVSIAFPPVLRRRPVTGPTTRRDAEMHPAIGGEVFKRKPARATRAAPVCRRQIDPVSHSGERFSPGLLASGCDGSRAVSTRAPSRDSRDRAFADSRARTRFHHRQGS